MLTRCTAIAACLLLGACSLNPFAKEASDAQASAADAATDAAASSRSQARSRSLEGRRAASGESAGTVAMSDSDSSSAGTAVPLAPDAPDRYIVKRGDTLWDISATFLADPWYWPEIWQVNPQVANPHLIYPGDELSLIYVDGQPRLRLRRGGIGTARLSPQIREQQLDEAINTISYEQIAAFLTRSAVLEKDEIDRLPYMLATRGDHLIAASGNDIYVRGPDGSLGGDGTRYNVINIGEALVDPDDDAVVGYEGTHVASGRLRRGGDPATVRLLKSSREAIAGDRLIDTDIDIPLNFFPKAPDSDINGRIISVVDGVSLIGQYQVVILNRGDRHGLAPGDVLSVFQTGETVRDRYAGGGSRYRPSRFLGEKVKLPDEAAGTVMVFKTYDRIAYALVMEATSDIHVLDAIRNPS